MKLNDLKEAIKKVEAKYGEINCPVIVVNDDGTNDQNLGTFKQGKIYHPMGSGSGITQNGTVFLALGIVINGKDDYEES
jgi:hypothetical protein